MEILFQSIQILFEFANLTSKSEDWRDRVGKWGVFLLGKLFNSQVVAYLDTQQVDMTPESLLERFVIPTKEESHSLLI